MDCCYIEQNESTGVEKIFSNVSSPEMFDSDVENKDSEEQIASVIEHSSSQINKENPSQATLIAKSDNYLLARVNKFLSGVPPPPRHTICQNNCNDFLLLIQKNHQYFWTTCPISEKKNVKPEETDRSPNRRKLENNQRFPFCHTNNTPRNLISAFDACDIYSDKVSKGDPSTNSQTVGSTEQETDVNNSNNLHSKSILLYNTIGEKEAASLPWPNAYFHKFHGIHYNRNKAVEEFENLTMKLCERYVGAETQSTCNVFFSKEPGSARKRNTLIKRNYGQSPGKRLSHLARRRRTFSSANLQGLGLNDKKQLVLNVKKPVSRKGKSPKGKSPRGKSPRGKSPRGSAKKRVVRRLTLENLSPCKSKLDTSKRALFQSPPSDKAGPSKVFNYGNSNPQTIKRALFPTPKKKEESTLEVVQKLGPEESRKRKSEEELEGPRFKWAKSLSFDCPHELQNNTLRSWDQGRHSSANVLSQHELTLAQGKCELSDTDRKKLLWAVSEALRGRGIGMSHPQFKQYAAQLARTVKKLMPDLENKNIPRKPGSTSDRMLKLAKHHALFIKNSRTTD